MTAITTTKHTVKIVCDHGDFDDATEKFTPRCEAERVITDLPVREHFAEYALGLAAGAGWLIELDQSCYCPEHRAEYEGE